MPSSGSSLRINGTCSSFSIQLLHYYYYQAKNIPVSKHEGGIEPRAPQAPEFGSGVHSTFNRPNLVYKEIRRHFGFWFCTDKFRFREVLRISSGAS